MSNLVIPVSFAQVMFRFSLVGDAEEMGFTIGVASGTGNLAADVISAVEDVEAAWKGVFANTGAQLLTAYTYRGVTATGNASDAGIFPIEVPRNVAGTGSGNPPPQNVTVLVKKRTSLGGRRHRGRLNAPPFNLDEGSVAANGDLSTSYQSGQQTGYDAWFTAVDATPSSIVILHRQETGGPVPPGPTAIIGFTVQTKVATQRRRLRR